MTSTSHTGLEASLSPETTRERLIAVSMYLAGFEVLTDAIVERVRSFYVDGSGPDGQVFDAKYQSRVLSRNHSPVLASLNWLAEHEVIEQADLASFVLVEVTRNRLARELPAIVSGNDSVPLAEHFELLLGLLSKIEQWWVVNFDIPGNPEPDESGIRDDQVVPASVQMLQMMREVMSGNGEPQA